MAKLIRQLIKSSPRADHTAQHLFAKALCRAQRRSTCQKPHRPVDADAIAAELEWLLQRELRGVNLQDPMSYQVVLATIQAWNPVYPVEEGVALQRCGFVQNGLLALLPPLKRKQQLAQLCQDYQRHLLCAAAKLRPSLERPLQAVVQAMAILPLLPAGKAATKPSPSTVKTVDKAFDQQADLSRITQKIQAVAQMQRTLQTRQDVDTQCRCFQQVFQAQRRVIEQDRDSAALTFVKAIVTVFSLGLAALLGIWNVKGQQTAREIDKVLQPPASPGA